MTKSVVTFNERAHSSSHTYIYIHALFSQRSVLYINHFLLPDSILRRNIQTFLCWTSSALLYNKSFNKKLSVVKRHPRVTSHIVETRTKPTFVFDVMLTTPPFWYSVPARCPKFTEITPQSRAKHSTSKVTSAWNQNLSTVLYVS